MDTKSERVVSLLSTKELDIVKKAANRSERSVSTFVRIAALREAWRQINEEKPELDLA